MTEQNVPAQELLLGKYKNMAELERGFRNQVMEMDKWKSVATTQQEQLKVLKETLEALQKQVTTPVTREPEVTLTPGEDGNLDPRAIERLIDARQKPLIDALKAVPKMMEEQIRSYFAPVQSSLKAKNEFFSREDVDAKFTDGELQKVLQRNPGINKAFEMLMSNPETQPQAYETAYELWRVTAGQAAKADPPKRQQAKRDASEPVSTSGPPLAVNGDPSLQQLHQLAEQAQNITGPDAELAFAREWIKGTNLEREIEKVRPDWAPEE